MNDAHVEVLEAGPVVNSSQENNTKENNENEGVSGSVLDLAITDTNSDSPGLDQNPVLDSRVVDNASSFKDLDMNDAHVEVLEAGSLVNSSQGNNTKESNEDVDVSGSILNHAGESSLQVRSDLTGEIAYEGEKNYHLDTEVASNEMHLDETGLNASGDTTETDPALNG
ncbi:hypothetical protein P8452_04945 [Trifolium repens]|nr:hypothetical protein P8452_04945 [Trifolium repens]